MESKFQLGAVFVGSALAIITICGTTIRSTRKSVDQFFKATQENLDNFIVAMKSIQHSDSENPDFSPTFGPLQRLATNLRPGSGQTLFGMKFAPNAESGISLIVDFVANSFLGNKLTSGREGSFAEIESRLGNLSNKELMDAFFEFVQELRTRVLT